jgi:acetyl-CoA carboxylase biotin carboxyl carrier protein
MHTDDVRQLSAWLEATDIDMLELQGPGERLCLRRNGTRIEIVPDGAQGAAAARTAVTAGCVGVFLHGHPLRGEALSVRGMRVRAGQVVGLLQVAALLLPVAASHDGIVAAVLVEPGTVVGYGTPLIELQLHWENT